MPLTAAAGDAGPGRATPPRPTPPPDATMAHPGADAWTAHRDALHRFVRRRVDDDATADDVVQEVALRALANQGALREPGSVRQWLYRITRNAVADHYRARRPHDPLPADLAAEDEAPSARRELSACLLPLIESLPAPYRDAVLLSEIQGLTQREAAERLGIGLSGAKSRVQRARTMLRERLLACCRVERDARGAIADYERTGGCGREGCGCAGGSSASVTGCGSTAE